MAEKKASKAASAYDITTHALVPKHRVISKDEEEALFSKYGINSKKMPRIRVDDPVVKAMGIESGSVVEITRPSPTAGETKYYRVVK